MKKHRAVIFITVTLILSACGSHRMRSLLKDVESYIMERPDSALAVLESVDRAELKTQHDRAHHALLHAMALDKNYIDVDDDSLASIALEYYSKHGPKMYEARSLYYLGLAYYYQKDYPKAILEFTKAVDVASKCDSLYWGMSLLASANTYSHTYNSPEGLSSLQKALHIYKGLKRQNSIDIVEFRLAQAYANIKEYDMADSLYNKLLDRVQNENLRNDIIGSYAHMKMVKRKPEFQDALALYNSLNEKGAVQYLTYDNYWSWAYALQLAGKKTESESLVRQLTIVDSSVTASYWKYCMAKQSKEYDNAFFYLEDATNKNNLIVEDLLKESLAATQRDHFHLQSMIAEYTLTNRTLIFAATISFTLLILLAVCMVAGKRIRNAREEKERLLGYIEETDRLFSLPSADGDNDSLKQKFVALYKSRFETLSVLCNQYLTYEGHEGAEKMMYKKVWSLIEEIRNDKVRRETFEKILDAELNGIMSNIRTEMPKLQEVDYTMFSYLIAGFDLTAISRLLDMSLNNVYAHKRRIRVKIERNRPSHAQQFLEMMS